MSYTGQAPPLTDEEIESLLKKNNVARICTGNKDGTIHAAPVWFKYENGEITVITPDRSRKARNVKRNKNVTILIDTEAPTRGVLIYGKAKLDDEYMSTAISTLEKYMPKEETKSYMEELSRKTNWVKITVKPERIASFNF